MPVLPTRVDPKAARFAENRAANLASVAQLHALLAKARAGGGPKYQARHQERGKLLVHERIDRLLDRGSPFLEVAPLAGCHEAGSAPGAAIVAGIGQASGVDCLVIANDPDRVGRRRHRDRVRKSAPTSPG